MKPRENFAVPIVALETHSASKMKFQGTASSFNSTIDAIYPTHMAQGAFTRALRKYSTVPVLKEHNPDYVLGKARLWQNTKGLQFEATLSNIPLAKEVYRLILDRVVGSVSIGFTVSHDHFESRNGIKTRIITEVDRLFEISAVLWPADELAVIDLLESDDEWIAEAASRYAVDIEIAQLVDEYNFNRMARRYRQ